MNKCYLENIPKNNKNFYWSKSVGREIEFYYEGIHGKFKILDYIIKNKHPFLKIIYNKKEFIVNSNCIKQCNLGRILGKITSDFKFKIGQTFKDNKRYFTIIDKKYRLQTSNNQNIKWYKYHCNNCGAELWMREYDINKKHMCSCCSNQTVVKGINDIATTHSQLIKYFVNIEDAYKYTYSSGTRIKMKCLNCGCEKDIKICDLYTRGFSCSKCSDGISYPNKFMFNLLEQLKLNFISEYSPEWIERKKYDFFIPEKQLIIEMDGAWHSKDNNISGQTVEESKEIDDYKDRLAKEHGIEVIRIDCNYGKITNRFEYIKQNIIHSKLNIIFDLNNIDWNECALYSESSLIIEVINLKKYNPNYTTGDIKKITGHSIGTIGRWLKIGNDLNLCDYNACRETKKVIKSNGLNNSKEIKMFKDGKYVDTFKSALELQNISEKRFGELLYSCEINRVCNKRKNNYKGYYFEFTNHKPINKIKYKKGKQVEVFKDGISKGIYESCNELARKSIEDFNEEFSISKISNVCNGKRKSHKGYTFEYIK
ncbi:TPA: hypothetical protein LA460_000242 [Clostridium botulinum]|nr:hypothetical protein [Clostridium botulinum]HBJ1652846.1 hypothetical protein [Clostridium botulinum]